MSHFGEFCGFTSEQETRAGGGFVLRVIGKYLSQIFELIFSLGVFEYGHNLIFPQLWLILMCLMIF